MRTLVDQEGVDDGSSPADVAPAPALPTRLGRFATPLALAVTAFGVLLRFVTTSPLWLDEALSVNIAALPVGDMLEALRRDGHPPLYYLVLHGWMEVFGDGDAAVRALSALFGIAALPLAWVAGRRLAGLSGARWALMVTALSPFAVRYSSETRMYSLVMLLTLAGYLLVTDALRQPTGRRLAGIALVSGLLLLTHYWSFYLLAAVGLLLAARWWRSPASRSATLRVMLAIGAGGVLFLPWVGGFLYQAGHTGTPWGTPYRPTEMLQTTLSDMGGGIYTEAFLFSSLLLVLVLVALFTRRAAGTEMTLDLRTAPTVRTELAVVGLTMAVGCAAGYLTSATYQSRYAAVFVPLLLLAVGVGITRIPGIARVLAGGAFLALSLAGVGWTFYYHRTQADVVADVVAARAQPGDVVVYCPDQLGPDYSRAMDRAVGDRVVQLSYPTLSSPRFVDWVDYADRNAAADPEAIAREVVERADGHAIFVVWMSEYRTYERQCETLVNSLGEARQLVAEDGKKYFEPANLHWFPAGTVEVVGRSNAADAPMS